jgi:hypothetical protein
VRTSPSASTPLQNRCRLVVRAAIYFDIRLLSFGATQVNRYFPHTYSFGSLFASCTLDLYCQPFTIDSVLQRQRLGSPCIPSHEQFLEALPAKASLHPASIPLSETSATRSLRRRTIHSLHRHQLRVIILRRKFRQIHGRERKSRRSLSFRDSFVSSRHNGLVHQTQNPQFQKFSASRNQAGGNPRNLKSASPSPLLPRSPLAQVEIRRIETQQETAGNREGTRSREATTRSCCRIKITTAPTRLVQRPEAYITSVRRRGSSRLSCNYVRQSWWVRGSFIDGAGALICGDWQRANSSNSIERSSR